MAVRRKISLRVKLGLLVVVVVGSLAGFLMLFFPARMNTLVLLVSLLGGVSAFGFIGIVLGPLVAAIATAVFESYLEPLPPAAEVPSPAGEPAVETDVQVVVKDAREVTLVRCDSGPARACARAP